MKEPAELLPNGTLVKTNRQLGTTDGLNCHPANLAARRPNTLGVIKDVLPGHGGDVYVVEHEYTQGVGIYSYAEFELWAPTDPRTIPPARPGSIREWMETQLVQYGLWPDEAVQIVWLVKEMAPPAVRWSDQLSAYPAHFPAVIWQTVRSTASKWLKKNVPWHPSRTTLASEAECSVVAAEVEAAIDARIKSEDSDLETVRPPSNPRNHE